MGKVKILYVIPDLSNAGPVNMCLNLVKNIDPSLFDIHVAALGTGVLFNEFSKFSKVTIYSRKKIISFINDINSGAFDVIHSHTIICDIFCYFLKNKKLKKISTIHNYPDIDSMYRRGRVIGGVLYQLQRVAIKKTLKVGCSDSVRDYCNKKLRMDKVISIPNGVDQITIERMKNDQKGINFFYLGGLNERKNVEELLKAYIMWDNNDSNFHIIGDGNLLNTLSSKYKNNRVHFHGKKDDPFNYIKLYDCFVSSSQAEGMPLALLESMSMGISYICSNIGPHIEVSENDNHKSGFIYELGNVEMLSEAFQKYYSSKDKIKMSESAKLCFEKYYTSRAMANKYSELYL